MAFLQDPPQLPHPYRSDRSLLALLDRAMPADRRAAIATVMASTGAPKRRVYDLALTIPR